MAESETVLFIGDDGERLVAEGVYNGSLIVTPKNRETYLVTMNAGGKLGIRRILPTEAQECTELENTNVLLAKKR